MKLSEAVRKIYDTHWTFTNNFHIVINWETPTISSFIGWDQNNDIDVNIVNFETPTFTTQPIESYIADKWILEDGVPELYNFNITIRDQDALKYHRIFLLAKIAQQKLYFDDYKFTVHFYKDADYKNEAESKELFKYENCKIASVGGLTFSNTEDAQIAQFTVNISCSMPSFETGDIGKL